MRYLLVILALLLGWAEVKAQSPSQLPACTSETTGLKYVDIEGSGIASLFFFPFLLAMAPVAGPTDDTGQYNCHLSVIGSDAAGAYRKIKNRPRVEPQ